MELDNGVVVIRIVLAAALGGALGFERELRDQPAGLRTHILVSLGACLFTLAGVFAFLEYGGSADSSGRFDVSRIASQVVVGIGFLGGGTILRDRGAVRGLTTAANLWVTAAVGLAVGLGFYVGAGVAALISLLSLAGLKPVGRKLQRSEPSDGNDPHQE